MATKIFHGGRRLGAGRKPKSGIPGDVTSMMRIPQSDKKAVQDLLAARRVLRIVATDTKPRSLKPNPTKLYTPLFGHKIAAGFPSPADDFVEASLDLNELLIKNPPATFFLEVMGESMLGAGIYPGDKLIVDRSIEPKHGDVVVAIVDSEYTVKRLHKRNGKVELRPENPNFPIITFKDGQELNIFGVVKNTIHKV